MKLEKEDKQYFIVGIIACFMIAAIVTFNVWMWRSPNRTEKPDSSKKEIQVVVKDSVETQRLRTMLNDLRAEFDRYKRQSERTKKFLTNKIQENETFKQKAVAGNDSALYHILDSLLARYGELSITRKNENGNSGGF
jgi:uncharacterized membrane protein